MKQRITGQVNRTRQVYEVVSPSGDVLKEIPLAEAANHPKLAAAIDRNGWEAM